MANRRYLIDTEVFIWLMQKNNKIPKVLLNFLGDPQNQIFLSVASIWEIVIKKGKKKLKIPRNVKSDVKKSGFTVLSIDIEHVLGVEKLPLIHRDPFDRILVSQAQFEKLTLITSDWRVQQYNAKFMKLKN